MGERLQVLVTLVPLLGFATDAEAEVQHLPVVPHHPDRFGDLSEHLARHPLHQCAVNPGRFCLGNPCTAGHDVSSGDVLSPCDPGHDSNVTNESDSADSPSSPDCPICA